MTRRGVLEALKVLTTAHDQTLERARVDVYCAALDDLNDDALMAAARTLVRVSKWFPKPAAPPGRGDRLGASLRTDSGDRPGRNS